MHCLTRCEPFCTTPAGRDSPAPPPRRRRPHPHNAASAWNNTHALAFRATAAPVPPGSRMATEYTPVTLVVAAVCVAVWFYLWNNRVDFERIAYSYHKVVGEREWWRAVSATFSHLEVWHLLFNVYSLWSSRSLEQQLGSFAYFRITCVLIVSGRRGA